MTDVYSFILVCVRIPRNERAICPKEAQKGRTCRRSAENINVMWISENRERREMKQRTEVLTPPPDIVISSFSHQTEEEGNNAQHIRSLGVLTGSSSVFSLRKDKKGKKKSKSREVRTSRDGVKDIDTEGDEVAYQKKLSSSLPPTLLFHECDVKHAST